ncbi:hypothetical protein VPH35_075892 [Triticum aestivum]
MDSTRASFSQMWHEQGIQLMVIISLMLQLILLFTGNHRWRRIRWRKISGFMRFIVWLVYVGADAIAVFTIGLFSQYEEKYKLRSHDSSAHDRMLPFLWAPFLLLHLGGQDTITAFSIEDNNLWLRHLLNLLIQVSLAMYVFWKSLDILNSHLLAVAVPIFVAGIIKYGERTWALQRGSRDSLGSRKVEEEESQDESVAGDVVAAYALKSVLQGRGLLAGRTMFQLGDGVKGHLVDNFADMGQREGKLKVVTMELRMIYDILYTKAMVLQSWTGRVLRCGALIAMLVAFVLFSMNQELQGHNKANVTITYALFVGSIFMEFYSASMVIVSPWTRACSKEGSFLCWLGRAASRKGLACPSMGQFNLTDYSLYEKSVPRFSKVIAALGLEKQWRNLWHIKHVEDKEIMEYIVGFFDDTDSGQRYQRLELGRKLNYLLSLPFEHALFRLHIFTDMHISRHLQLGGDASHSALLVAECRKISDYLMYLMVVHPSMLPVSTAAQDLEPCFAEWIRHNHSDNMTKREILEAYANQRLYNERFSSCPFEEFPSMHSLSELKEVLVRVLIYAAGKCPMELHARKLSDGVEPLTVVASIMMHHGLGDVGREFKLLASDDPHVPTPGSLVSVDQSSWIRRPQGPLYAFEFYQHAYEYDHQTWSLLQPSQEYPRLFVRAWAPRDMVYQSWMSRWEGGQAGWSTSEREQTDWSSSDIQQHVVNMNGLNLPLPLHTQPGQFPSLPVTNSIIYNSFLVFRHVSYTHLVDTCRMPPLILMWDRRCIGRHRRHGKLISHRRRICTELIYQLTHKSNKLHRERIPHLKLIWHWRCICHHQRLSKFIRHQRSTNLTYRCPHSPNNLQYNRILKLLWHQKQSKSK